MKIPLCAFSTKWCAWFSLKEFVEETVSPFLSSRLKNDKKGSEEHPSTKCSSFRKMSLACVFQVRLCNFKASGIQTAAGAAPPFCVRGNFDGRAFNSEYFHSATMAPIWALDTNFEYQCPTVDTLRTKFLVLECYGNDRFLGMSRIDLFTLATGPTTVELSIKEGSKVNGILSFEAQFQQITSVQIQLARIALKNLGNRGYEGAPNPYLSFGLAANGVTLESAVAAEADRPEWDRLPALHFRGSFQSLCDQRIKFDLKHSRNGFTVGLNDPLMATFELNLAALPIEFGRDSAIPFREMVHSMPNYPFPFSCECTGLLEVRNLPQVVQLRGGVLTDEGIVGGVQRVHGAPSGDAPLGLEPNNQSHKVSLPTKSALVSPSRLGRSAAPAHSHQSQLPATNASSYHSAFDTIAQPSFSASAVEPAASYNASFVPATGMDVELLNEVSEKQQTLLNTVQDRLRQIARRRGEIAHEIANAKVREEEHLEASSRRRMSIQADLRAALAEKERLESLLKTISYRREEEMQTSARLAAEREKARMAIDAEQQEVNLLQDRVNQLRTEMNRHLEEEELRYAQRVREAEEARRRAQRDAEDLAALEAKLSNAESRMQRGLSALRSFSPRRH
jgi:hypothetical protein